MSNVEENKNSIKALFEALSKRPFDAQSVAPFVHKDVSSTRAETYVEGREHWFNNLSVLIDTWMPDFSYEIVNMIGEGDQVWVFGVVHGFAKSFLPNPDIERRESVDVFRFTKDGLLIEHFDVQQNALRQKNLLQLTPGQSV